MEDSSNLVVNVETTSKDYLARWKASRFRHFQWLFYLIAATYSYLAVAGSVNHWNEGFEISTVGLYLFVALFAVFAVVSAPRIRARLLFESPLAKEPRQYSISSSGISLMSELSAAEYKWGAFVQIVETKALFCFFQSHLYALIVPKRCFSGATDVPRLREMLQTHFRGKVSLIGE